jgi:hypothetical protein
MKLTLPVVPLNPLIRWTARKPRGEKAAGMVDMTLEANGQEWFVSVNSKATKKELQRLEMNLFGYWYARMSDGEGYMGQLQPHDHVVLMPGTTADIAMVTQ